MPKAARSVSPPPERSKRRRHSEKPLNARKMKEYLIAGDDPLNYTYSQHQNPAVARSQTTPRSFSIDDRTGFNDGPQDAQDRSRTQGQSPAQMQEELDYLKTALSRIHGALTAKPDPDQRGEPEVRIPFHRKFVRHYRMFETILTSAKLRRAHEPNDPPPARIGGPDAGDGDLDPTGMSNLRSTLASAAPVDEWFGRIFQELHVDTLNLKSREEQCVVTLERICDMKETNQTLRNEVIQMEQLLSSMRTQKGVQQGETEELRARNMEVGQRVEKVVIKALGLKDRLGSLAKTLTRVELPRINRLASELRLQPIHTTLDMHSPATTQLESLLTALDSMKALTRKAEVMIRDGLVNQTQNAKPGQPSMGSQHSADSSIPAHNPSTGVIGRGGDYGKM